MEKSNLKATHIIITLPVGLMQILNNSLCFFFLLFSHSGMTSEGGGAVAFPVMTLAFSIAPDVARDFSIMIQSCGMSAAAFTIYFMKVQLEWHSIILCSIGGVFGSICGFEVVSSFLFLRDTTCR